MGFIQWIVLLVIIIRRFSKFFSRFWNPGCSGVDFFVQNLDGESCLVVPQVSL